MKDKQRPAWQDTEKLSLACDFYREHTFSIYMSCLSGLLYLLAVPSIAETLNFTRNSDTKVKSFRRYFQTLRFMHTWYQIESWRDDNATYQTLSQVRRIHETVAKRQFHDYQSPSPDFSQRDLMLTQFAFVGPILLYPGKLGIRCERAEMEGLIHLWKCIGYYLEIDSENNLCSGNYDEVLQKCEIVVQKSIRPCLIYPNDLFKKLSVNLIEGMSIMIPMLDYHSFLKFTYNLFGVKYPETLSWNEFFLYWLQRIVCRFLLYYFARCRRFFNRLLLGAMKRSLIIYNTKYK